jgi:hypothetical protein
VYDSSSLKLLKVIQEHTWEVWQLSIRDGLLFSGSFDHSIKVRTLLLYMA